MFFFPNGVTLAYEVCKKTDSEKKFRTGENYDFENINTKYNFLIYFLEVTKLLEEYCSNSCISLHFKTLKSQTKIVKIAPTCFGLL